MRIAMDWLTRDQARSVGFDANHNPVTRAVRVTAPPPAGLANAAARVFGPVRESA